MQILIIHDDIVLHEKLAFNLRSEFDCDILTAVGFDEAKEKLAKDSIAPDIFILSITEDFHSVLKNFQSNFPDLKRCPILISVTDLEKAKSENRNDSIRFISRSQLAADTFKVIKELAEQKSIIYPPAEELFCKIHTSVLLECCPLQGDVYLKLGPNKFIKVRHSKDYFDKEDFEHFTVKKNIEYLYVRRDQTNEFVSNFNGYLEELLRKDQSEALDAVSKDADKFISTIKEFGHKIGFSKEIQKMAKLQVEVSVKAIGRNPKISDILKRHLKGDRPYLTAHSHLTAAIGCAIANQMGWGSFTTFQKLTTAAYFHDIALDSDDLARVERLTDSAKKMLNEDEINEVQNHPMIAAEILKQFNELPPDINIIIMQHHEKPDGSGFPGGTKNTLVISPLSAVFIIAHELAKFAYIENADNEKLKLKINEMTDTYDHGNFRKIVKSLKEGFDLST